MCCSRCQECGHPIEQRTIEIEGEFIGVFEEITVCKDCARTLYRIHLPFQINIHT